MKDLTPDDSIACKNAIDLAESADPDMQDAAYRTFCVLERTYPDNLTILSWLAYTTPRADEARRALTSIVKLYPAAPSLPSLRAYVARREEEEPKPEPEPVPMNAPPLPEAGGCRQIILIALGVAGGILIAFLLIAMTQPDFWVGFWQGFCGSAPALCHLPLSPTPTPIAP